MPRCVAMPTANDKRRRPERTETIRTLKPPISNIPKSVSATVAAHANNAVGELGKRDTTKRSATAHKKEAPSANRANRRTISVPFSLSCVACEFIQGIPPMQASLVESRPNKILRDPKGYRTAPLQGYSP